MTYIGTPTSRIDGHAKVTGAAKYAGEFNIKGLAYGAVVASTIAKGRITRIDTSDALRVEGVLDILTHENRPPMARADGAYKDDVAPEEGAPFRPLYDDKIKFNGQPIALVLAEEWEIARFAASLLRIEYKKSDFVTDLHAQRDKAFVVEKPEKTRGTADKAYAASAVRHEAEYFIPTEHHNPMELYASTVMWDGDGKLTVYDKTQGVQNVQRYLCGIFNMKPDDVRVISPFVGGAFGSGLRPQYQVVLAVLAARALQRSVRLVLTRQQMYGLCNRPATIERVALGATADGTLDAVIHEAIAMTSQYEDFSRNDTGWSGLLYNSPNAKYVHRLARLDLPTPCDMRAPGAATGVYGLECAMDELAVALKLDPLELRLRCYSDRDQHEDIPYTSKELRECYRQGAAAFGWDKRNPRRQRIGRLGRGHWRLGSAADGVRRPHRADGQWTRRDRVRFLRHRYRHLHDRGADDRRSARPAARQHHGQARRLYAAASTCRRRLMDGCLGIARHCQDRRAVAQGALARGEDHAGLAACRRKGGWRRAYRRQDRRQKGHKAIGVDRRRDASWSPRSHRAGEHQHVRQWLFARAKHTFGDLCGGEGG